MKGWFSIALIECKIGGVGEAMVFSLKGRIRQPISDRLGKHD